MKIMDPNINQWFVWDTRDVHMSLLKCKMAPKPKGYYDAHWKKGLGERTACMGFSIKAFVERIFQVTGLISLARFQRASWYDIYFCFRLVLNRNPSRKEFAWWRKNVNERKMGLTELLASFIGSEEFLKLSQELKQPQLVSLPLYKIYVRPNDVLIGAAIARDHEYEPDITALLKRWLKPGMTFVDIGANIGYFSLLTATLIGEQGQVFSFEPAPGNIALLEKSISENGFGNVKVFPVAVDEIDSTLPFTVSGISSNGRLDPFNDGKESNIEVEAKSLDGMKDIVQSVDYIKMDIEGAEPRALRGMKTLLKTNRPTIIFEFAPKQILETSQEDPKGVLNFLDDLGYRLYKVSTLVNSQDLLSNVVDINNLMRESEQLRQFAHFDLVAIHQDKFQTYLV